jgi:hypothetical protein
LGASSGEKALFFAANSPLEAEVAEAEVESLDVQTLPHQFRTRNGRTETQRTRSISSENAGRSTKLVNIPSLITVWLQLQAGLESSMRVSSPWLASDNHQPAARVALMSLAAH